MPIFLFAKLRKTLPVTLTFIAIFTVSEVRAQLARKSGSSRSGKISTGKLGGMASTLSCSIFNRTRKKSLQRLNFDFFPSEFYTTVRMDAKAIVNELLFDYLPLKAHPPQPGRISIPTSGTMEIETTPVRSQNFKKSTKAYFSKLNTKLSELKFKSKREKVLENSFCSKNFNDLGTSVSFEPKSPESLKLAKTSREDPVIKEAIAKITLYARKTLALRVSEEEFQKMKSLHKHRQYPKNASQQQKKHFDTMSKLKDYEDFMKLYTSPAKIFSLLKKYQKKATLTHLANPKNHPQLEIQKVVAQSSSRRHGDLTCNRKYVGHDTSISCDKSGSRDPTPLPNPKENNETINNTGTWVDS